MAKQEEEITTGNKRHDLRLAILSALLYNKPENK